MHFEIIHVLNGASLKLFRFESFMFNFKFFTFLNSRFFNFIFCSLEFYIIKYSSALLNIV